MKISVVIPVYNEAHRIRECLDALTANTRQADEILVADGGSKDNTRQIVREYPNVQLLDNPGKTAAAGRNTAIAAASGDVIAFTDGDCIPDVRWLEEIEKAFLQYDIDGAGGKVTCAAPDNHYEEYWGNLAWNLIMNFPDEPYTVNRQTLNDAFVTANCAYRTDLLKKINGFDLWYANNAEDVDLCWRALKENARLMYIPNIRIRAHNVNSLKGIRKKSFRNGVSSSKLQKRYGGRFNYDKNIYRMLGQNLKGLFTGTADAWLNVNELVWHLLGKYYGSIKARVINI